MGDDANDLNTRALRGSLLIEPNEAISNTTIIDYFRNNSTGGGSVLFQALPGPNALSATGTLQAALDQFALQQARGPRVIDSDVDAFERAKRIGVTNRTEIAVTPGLDIVNIFGYRRTKVDYFSSVDGLPTLISDGSGAIPAGLPVTVVGGRQKSDVQQLSNELQIKGRMFDDRLDWLIGGFYLKSEPKGPSGTYIPIFILPGINDAPFNYSFYEEESKALFANIGFDLFGLAEGLRLNAGFRYTWDDIEACVGGGTSPDPIVTPEECRTGSANIVNQSVNRSSSKAPTWQVGLDWQVNPDLFLYVVTRRGYRAGGINTPTLGGSLAPLQSFAPEKVTDIEAGIRSDFLAAGVPVRLNASPFMGWYSNVQVPISGLNTTAVCGTGAGGSNPPGSSPDGDCNPDNDPSGGTLLVNAGKTRVAGIDLSGAISPAPGLTIDAAATFLDLKSRSLSVPPLLVGYLASPEVPFNLVPKNTISAGVRWELPFPDSFADATVSADDYHSSKVQSSDAVLPAYDLVNVRLDLNELARTGLDASIFVRNVFDEEYLASANVGAAVLGIFSGFYGAPRTYGLELRYRFVE